MQNTFVESFNGRLRDEFLNETLFTSCRRRASHSKTGDATTIMHHNTHLSMLLKRRNFADRDAIPRGALGSVARVL